MKLTQLAFVVLCLVFTALPAQSKGVYQTSEDFIVQALQAPVPKAKIFWLDDQAKQTIESILAHRYHKMRLRYWQQGNETVWILDEIGKESPITVGVHIKNQQIAQTKVLIYRESRGDEVRHNFFTDQFKSAKLTDDLNLDTHIDGITGATLSVRALTKLSKIALWLDAHVANSKN